MAVRKPEDLVANTGVFSGMNSLMAIASMIMILGFVGFTISDVEFASGVFAQGKDFIIGTLDWFYVLVVNLALFFVFWLLMSLLQVLIPVKGYVSGTCWWI